MGEAISALLVEDDARLAAFLADYLEQHQISVTPAVDGEEAVAMTSRGRFDVVLLDLMLPRRNGLAVCRQIRGTSDVPIIIITARTEEADRVLGLETGADDYVMKPFLPRELLARVHAVVRRDRGDLAPKARTITVGALALQTASRTATLAGEPVPLTTAEFDMLLALAQRPGRIFSRDQLLRLSRGSDAEAFERAVDVQISRIRQKLSTYAEGATLIRTVRGVGYMLVEKPTAC